MKQVLGLIRARDGDAVVEMHAAVGDNVYDEVATGFGRTLVVRPAVELRFVPGPRVLQSDMPFEALVS